MKQLGVKEGRHFVCRLSDKRELLLFASLPLRATLPVLSSRGGGV